MKKLLYFAFFSIFAFFTGSIADTITINWLNTDKTINQTTTCNIGGDLILPDAPTKPGYDFVGWVANYTPIEYLESTGTQWIDTEYVLTSDNVRYLSKFLLKSNNSAAFGSQNTSKPGARFSGIHYFSDNDTLYSATGTSDRLCAQRYTTNTVCEIDTVINQGQVQKTQNGVTLFANYAGSVQTGLPIALFGDRFQNGIRETGSGARMYYFKMYENNILVRDFIPVLDSNGIPCMYDQVEDKFYYNAGTGDFIAGPVVGGGS